jgi:hypothetical protein
MSNPFEIAANATMPELPSTLNPVAKAPRPGPKLKSLAERKSLHTLQLARHNATPIATTAEGLLAQFKVNIDNESDSESSNNGDIRRRSVTGKVTQRYYIKGISIKVGTKYFWALGILDQGAHGDAEVLHGGTSILDLRRPRV